MFVNNVGQCCSKLEEANKRADMEKSFSSLLKLFLFLIIAVFNHLQIKDGWIIQGTMYVVKFIMQPLLLKYFMLHPKSYFVSKQWKFFFHVWIKDVPQFTIDPTTWKSPTKQMFYKKDLFYETLIGFLINAINHTKSRFRVRSPSHPRSATILTFQWWFTAFFLINYKLR